MSARYKSNAATVERAFREKFQKGAVNMAGDILRESTPVTPWREGDLRQRRRVKAVPGGAQAIWDACHAAVQNRGRRAGARPFTDYTTPGTGAGFVEKGIKAVTVRLKEYFR